MRLMLLAALALGCCGLALARDAADPLTQPVQCERCAKWNEPVTPFRVYGNTYYVGVRGMSSLLVATSGGLILLDGDLPQSAPLIEANLRALGFRVEDIRMILTSHGHFDHVGGVAALQRDSGAQVAASPSTAEALRLGHAVPDDPQAGYIDGAGFPPLKAAVRLVRDGEVLKLDDVAVTAHFTPGHTPGSTSWSWKSCEGQRCLDVVYADSLNPVAAPGFRYTGDRGHPDVTPRFRVSIDAVAALPCDIIVTVHPEVGHLWDKLEARRRGVQPDPLIAPESCRVYADAMRQLLDERIAKEKAEAPQPLRN
jgi:metallo-beta-lactamase class B